MSAAPPPREEGTSVAAGAASPGAASPGAASPGAASPGAASPGAAVGTAAAAGVTPILEIDAASLRRGREEVLGALRLAFRPGERVALIGPNGVGKSTLLRALAGVDAASAADVRVAGRALPQWSRRALSREIALLTQRPELPFPFTAMETVLLGRSPWLGAFGMPAPRDVEQARALLAQLGMEGMEERAMGSLSGGEQQRVHFARAMVQEARITLLDEPTGAQDFRGIARMMELLAARAAEGGLVVVALHDLNLAPRFFDRVLLLCEGAVVADGAPEAVLRSDALERAYGHALEVRTLEGEAGLVVLPRSAARKPGAG